MSLLCQINKILLLCPRANTQVQTHLKKKKIKICKLFGNLADESTAIFYLFFI